MDLELHDATGRDDLLDPDDTSDGQTIGRALREAESNGIVYPSVRHEGGCCIGVFWPDLLPILV
ncbi:RES family NAD+ phosphorylase [Roseibium aestuarii]|uniref:RES family NAD+ phosphorylase n=1 Tax=Roseibium aestuarii TaxID=2600299 RepID=A0ABW4JRL3_9HYPH